ncbi:serine hydrolase-like protein [Schistocerca nitens]|uniref:serine hydrolase-like protein n=1 Tax=Schistocerca nitens TaxID=7011 RepID=UPI0021189526|nr:serine hydrolase-like protein [Schistocerca nitens]
MSKAVTSDDSSNDPNPLTFTEIEIPVPWGKIAAKIWGAADNIPLLAVHGLQDNAGTFDRLVPFLPKHFYIVCIDLPGHGCSSHFPPGFVLHYMDYILSVRRVVDFFKWKQFYFLGHSYGAQLGAYFSAFWPEHIIKLVMLDAISTFVYSDFMDRFPVSSSRLLNMENRIAKKQPPAYSFEEALQRMLESRISKLTDDAAKTLIMRSLVKRNNGVGFSTDQRLKFAAWVPWGPEQNVNILQRIRCPQLIVLASQSLPILSQSFSREMKMFRSRKNFTCIVVDGNHDVHNNQPEIVGPIVTKFFTADKSSL